MWDISFDKPGQQKYLILIEHIIDCINTGKLKFGEPLPTQRVLSKELGLSVGTITKAFNELERIGYITGQIGRGTFVKDFSGTSDEATDPDNEGNIKYNFGHFKTPEYVGTSAQMALMSGLQETISQENFFSKLNDSFTGGTGDQREASRTWLDLVGVQTQSIENIVITNSITHSTTLIIQTYCVPNDVILVEEVCNPVLRDQILFNHMRIQGIEMDEFGIIPERLEELIKSKKPKLLITNPTIHNPTTITTPTDRKIKIARIAEQYGLMICEQGDLDHFHEKMPTSYYELIPEQALYLSSLTNSVNAAMRMGVVAGSTDHISKLNMAIRISVWMTSHLNNETCAYLIRSGKAQEILKHKKRVAEERNKLLTSTLRGFEVQQYKYGFHVWLKLPEQWTAIEFANQTFDDGILIRNGQIFQVGNSPSASYVRISLGAILSDTTFREGLELLKAKLLAHPSILLQSLSQQ